MELQAFENLELIPLLLQKIENMEERMRKLAPPITTKKEVARFLNKSQSSINSYMAKGLLKYGYHYTKKNDRILVFNEDAILEFRDKLEKGIAHEEVTI